MKFSTDDIVTPEEVYLKRREFLAASGFVGASLLLRQAGAVAYSVNDPDRPVTKEDHATTYNNYYEFSLDKKELRKLRM